MINRQQHQQEVRGYLQKHFSSHDWTFSLPHGSGMETYFVQGSAQAYFVKVGAPVERYLVMAELGLAPPVLSFGRLESGMSILVQPLIPGRSPSRVDLQNRLEMVAGLVCKMHRDPRIQAALQPAGSSLYRAAGLHALQLLLRRWLPYKGQVPDAAALVDHGLEELARQIDQFPGEGLAASHGDICNANWLFASDGRIYIIDLESMSLDDPALDVGALLWWYYPPQLRQQFLGIAGYPFDDGFRHRMRVRMALHCLHIMLPREKGFDELYPDRFYEFLGDFKALLEGRENPQGYMS